MVAADPGCGKSVLAKSLVKNELPTANTCYFFFKDQDQNSVRQALYALLHQLFYKKPFLIQHAMPSYERNGEWLVQVTAELWYIFDSAVRDPRTGPVFFVLDALDECDRSELGDLVQHVLTYCPRDEYDPQSQVKFLFTSRPYRQIMSEVPRTPGGLAKRPHPGRREL